MTSNQSPRNTLSSFLRERPHQLVVSLSGPRFLGKSSFLRELLGTELHEADFLEMQAGVDGAREAVEFSKTDPVGSPLKALLVDDADRLGEPAQDALLKICEEPPAHFAVFLVAHDVGHLQPALASRIRHDVRWLPLTDQEMREFASSLLLEVSEPALRLACGRPGLYRVIAETGGFEELYELASRACAKQITLLDRPPKLIDDLENGHSPVRDAIIHVLRQVSRKVLDNSHAACEILRFCNVLASSPSANAEIHWSRMVSSLSM